MDGWNTNFLLGWPIFRGYVSFRECKPQGKSSSDTFCCTTWRVQLDEKITTLQHQPRCISHWSFVQRTHAVSSDFLFLGSGHSRFVVSFRGICEKKDPLFFWGSCWRSLVLRDLKWYVSFSFDVDTYIRDISANVKGRRFQRELHRTFNEGSKSRNKKWRIRFCNGLILW